MTRLLVFLTLGTILCSIVRGEPGEPVSLLSNGQFAIDAKNAGWPDDWPHGEGISFEKEGDQHFLRLTSGKPGQMVMAYRQVLLPTPRPLALRVRLKVRYVDIKPGKQAWFDGRVLAHFKNSAGHVVKPDPATPYFRGTSKGWVDQNYVVKVPATAQLFEIMPCLFQPAGGTLDLARCEVFVATAEDLPKPPPIIPSNILVSPDTSHLPPTLHVSGNQLQTGDGKPVWLQGLCVDSLEWSVAGEHLLQSISVAIDSWKADIIRLPVTEEFWFGRHAYQKDGGLAYRKLVDQVVELAAARGAYVALDLHRFGAPLPEHVEFWKDAATRYKNHPAVLFELFNEPHSISWKIWRDGGNPAKNPEEEPELMSPGMQGLLDAARSSGASNVAIAGGLDWGYDLSGVVKEFALQERSGGNGVMYSSHIYPWKKDWQAHTLDAAAKYPIFVGEVGSPPDWKGFEFIPPGQRFEDLGGPRWPTDVLAMIQQHKLNWTGFSFHPKCGPMVISDWNYTPTPYWGNYVKEALAGKSFDGKSLR